MPGVRLETGSWVVVCDGAKGLILENVGDGKFPNLKTRQVYEHENLATRELGTDAPGRGPGPNGSGRVGAMEQTDWHAQAEQRFIADLISRLDAAVSAGEVRSLVIVAPPRALGAIRQEYSPGLKKAVRAEIDKDFVKMPVHEIEKHLVGDGELPPVPVR